MSRGRSRGHPRCPWGPGRLRLEAMTSSPTADRASRTPRLVLAILAIAVVATPVLAYPYVLLDRAASRIDVQTDAAWVLLVIHVPGAAAAMILGALQFVPRIRAHRARHRAIGRT